MIMLFELCKTAGYLDHQVVSMWYNVFCFLTLSASNLPNWFVQGEIQYYDSPVICQLNPV